jgi:hypothetical protein
MQILLMHEGGFMISNKCANDPDDVFLLVPDYFLIYNYVSFAYLI